MKVKFTWDTDDLGPLWMNIDNLKSLLYTSAHTRKDLLQVEVINGKQVAKPDPLPEEFILAEDAAEVLSLSKAVFINLSNRKDINCETTWRGKRVWVREDILKLKKELENGI